MNACTEPLPFGTAAILAGGRSKRMGFDKSDILLDRIATSLAGVFSDIVVITGRSVAHPLVRTAADEFEGCGPLGGIHAALKNAKSKYVYVVACDMPDFCADFARDMMRAVRESAPAACAVRRECGKIEPFHAFYARSLLPGLEADLEGGLTSPQKFLLGSKALFIEEKKAPDIFTNINTPKDLDMWRNLLKNGHKKQG